MNNTKIKYVTLYWLAIISLIFYLFYLKQLKSTDRNQEMEGAELQAARLMVRAEKLIFSYEQQIGLKPENNRFDLNQTGLIGLEQSPLTTTLGNLEAKRTTTNPNVAALLVYLLKKAGVKRGDTVALGASGSFPALILASICAAQALEADILIIASLGASQWGANNPNFTLLDLEEGLRFTGFNPHRFLAVSWGGEDDSGKEFPTALKIKLREKAAKLKIYFLEPKELREMVREHVSIYENYAGGKITAFINAGGSLVNLGRDSSVLELPPGLTTVKKIPPPQSRGLIQEMAASGIPVIHLLNIRGLARRYGLPWDPQPLPRPGEGINWTDGKWNKLKAAISFSFYILTMLVAALILSFIHKKRG